MANKAIGPSFESELKAAGLMGLPFAWGADGVFSWGGAITDIQKAGVLAVYAAHDPTDIKPLLRAYAATKRYAIETGGIVVGGARIATDRESQAMINGAYGATVMDPDFSTQWKGADGAWATLVAAQIVAIASAVKDHVAACFAAEKSVDDAIVAGTITSPSQIDAAAWPTN